MFGLAQISHFGLLDIIPPEPQLAFHIYDVKYENALTCKSISWDYGVWEGEWCFKNNFFISNKYNTKSDNFSPEIKQYIFGNWKPNAKS